MGKPTRGPGKAKDRKPGSKYPGPLVSDPNATSDWPGPHSKWPGPQIKWPGPLAPDELSDKLLHGKEAMEGKYGESLKGLLQINPVEVLHEASSDEALFAYDQLLDVLKQASRKGVDAEHLGTGIRNLGPYGIRLAQSTRGLADAIELDAGLSTDVSLSPGKGPK